MAGPFDLVVANARLRRRGPGEPLMHLGIRDGRIAALGPAALAGQTVVDADGNLVSPSFVNAHLHLDKVYTIGLAGEEARRRYAGGRMEGAAAAIDLAARVKDDYDESWIYANARRALADGLTHGVTHLLAFADTDSRARLEGIKALLRLREEWRGRVEVRVVAFPQDGIVRDAGAEDYVRAALELGADVVGGIPWIEETAAAAAEHVDRMLALARAYDRDVAMLTDDAGDPALRTTEMLAAAAIREGWTGRVIACHARAMALYSEQTFRDLVGLARRAELAFVTAPHTGPLHLRAADLLAAGFPVALGQDDIADAYYPYGRHNLLEVAFLASHLLGWTTAAEMETLLDMVTSQGARVLRLAGYGLEVGREAHLCVLQGETPQEVLARHEPPRVVISHGRVAVETQGRTEFVEMPRR